MSPPSAYFSQRNCPCQAKVSKDVGAGRDLPHSSPARRLVAGAMRTRQAARPLGARE